MAQLTHDDLIRFRQILDEKLRFLARESSTTRENRATVMLDQQSVGRLSRMDALQQQAMANAEQRRREVETQKTKAALARLETGEFGACLECGDQIAPKRLEFDPTVPTCITCASG